MVPVEEPLRLAYLVAMDIAVWVPRGADDPPSTAVQTPVRERRSAGSGAHLTRAALGSVLGTAAPVPRTEPAERDVVAQHRANAAGHAAVSLEIALVGDALFIDETPSEIEAPSASSLLGSMAFALGGKSGPIDLQSFDWPPPGVTVDALQTRDAVLARLRKRLQERTVRCIVLMGAVPAGVLLGWDAARFKQRDGRPQLIQGVDVPVFVTLSSTVLLQEPARKRDAWRDIRIARS